MKLDKKQLPQFIVLGVLTAGVSGYTVFHFVSTGPVSAAPRPAAAPVSPRPASLPGQATKPGDPRFPAAPAGAAAPAAGTAAPAAGTAAPVVAAGDTGDAPPPSPAMHDPFAIGYVDPGTLPAAALTAALPKAASGKQIAALPALSPLPIGLPTAPPLPGGSFSGGSFSGGSFSGSSVKSLVLPAAPAAPALPVAPARPDPPKWTVTGVLMGAGGEVAILRSGDARRIVRAGDFVDGVYRVTGVSRTAVQLRHGKSVYHLVLGGANPAAGAPVPAAPISAPAAAPQTRVQTPAMLGRAIIPVYHSVQPHAPLVHLVQQEPEMTLAAAGPTLPPVTQKPAAAKFARAISLGLRLLDGSVLAPRKE